MNTQEIVPNIYIKAINPGYSVDSVANVGEMIEIARREDSDTPISFAGLTLGYTNSSGNYTVLVDFSEHLYLVGESILLRLASSPESELAAVTYNKTLAFKAGPLELRRGDTIIDSICWTGKDGCSAEFKSNKPTTLVRDLTTGEFNHVENYVPVYDEKSYYIEAVAEVLDESDIQNPQCKGLIFSELLSYYEESQSEQFIELYNTGSEQILLDGCQIKYKNKKYGLSGILKPEQYYARHLNDFSLTKNPTTTNWLEIIDVNDSVVDKVEYPNGQRKGTSYALIGYDQDGKAIWRTTYAPTPGEANNYQEFRTCEEGKVINETTGNCVKITTVAEKTCEAGYYLNPASGRCKKIEIAKEVVCKDGYYLNEETGKCRKIQNNTGANYSLPVEEYEENSYFVGVLAVAIVLLVGIIYIIYEFRREILKLWRKAFRRFR